MSVGRFLQQAAAGSADTGDDDFANVVLLLDGDGTSGDDNETFTDSGSVGATITENGSAIQGSFSPYGNNWSNYFDGSGDGVSIATASALDWGTSTDFTMECWFYSNVALTSNTILFDTRNTSSASTGVLFGINSSSKLVLVVLNNFDITGTTSIEAGQWYHLAVVRNSGTFEVFIDGVSEATSSTSRNIQNASGITVGGKQLSSTSYDSPTGYISNARVVSGTAVYTSGYTAPTSPLTAITNTSLLTCQSNRFKDNSSNDYSVTLAGTPKVTPFSPFKDNNAKDITTDGGSVLFGPSGDYLQLPSNSAYNATSSLCAECWFYMVGAPGAASSAHCPLSRWVSTTAGQRAWFFDIENTGVRMRVDTATNSAGQVVIDDSTGALNRYAWYHIALTWDGSTYRGFLNGELIGSLSDSNAPRGTTQVIRVGYNTNSHYMDGYVSDCRVLVDQGPVYTSAFTPPTAPLGNFGANTPKLLLNFQDAGIYDLSGINNIDTVGNAQIDTAVKKYGTGSIQFDGTGDYLTFDHSLNEISFGTGDFTIEGWFYIQSGDEYPYALDFRNTGSQAAPALYFYNYGNGSIDYYVSGASRILGTSAGNDVWQHIAICREGTSTRMFVNGTQSGSTYTDSTNYSAYSGNIGIKYDNVRPFKGFIDDFRITKGYARYTSNFTAPDAALPKF